MTNPTKIMQRMHGSITYLFDFWANLFVHLLLLKSSMIMPIIIYAIALPYIKLHWVHGMVLRQVAQINGNTITTF